MAHDATGAAAAAGSRLTLAELQERMGHPRSSPHALPRTLRELKRIETGPAGSAFGVGPHALLSGSTYLDLDPAYPYACDALEDLRAEVGHTTNYARRDGAHVLYLATRERSGAQPLFSRVGRRVPAHITALGLALLAARTPAEVRAVLGPTLRPYTRHTLTTHTRLHGWLEGVRAQGWACESEHGIPGVTCVAAVVDHRIPPSDAISCSMPVAEATPEELARVAAAVVASAGKLATRLRRAGIR
ncbi:IclR family transcriptional regulator [Actinophytocola sp.]|uniref:IclR family transcriptional regulator n=1 Tax=Actinophytocola sp. TaxID=1872138 RepID=UPI002D7E4614|nr:IclR family transcriptional regulator C-terminal domain-containing protein [Actinophytocola sp.]HET9141562.1 IclR family transcriptional regulator C-terminal domain-containing protein [Actinophytocola sp.]